MKTPMLLAVSKDQPSRKERLEAFKLKHSIQTHSSGVKWRSDVNKPWCALHMPSARMFGCGITECSDLFDCISKACRLLDDAGVIGYGDTEREAIRAACEAVNIPFGL